MVPSDTISVLVFQGLTKPCSTLLSKKEFPSSQQMGAKTCKEIIPLLETFYSTIVAPFEKREVAQMKTTNDIEKCVLEKIFH